MTYRSCCHALFAIGCFGILASQSSAADIVAKWDGSFLNTWSDTTRWTTAPDSSPIVPNNSGSTFEVFVVTGNVVQNVAGGVTLSSLHLLDAFLSGSEPVTIGGDPADPLLISAWVGSTQNSEIWNTGGVTVGSDATLQISGGNSKSIGAPDNNDGSVDQVILTVDGKVVFSGGGGLRAGGEGALVNISSSGKFEWTSDADFIGFSPGKLNNAGTWTKSAGTGLAQVGSNWVVHNTGTFRVESGNVIFNSTANGFDNDGTVEVAGNGTTLQLGGGTSTGTTDIANEATLEFQSNNITIQHDFDGATAALTNDGTVVIEGNISFSNGASYSGAGAVQFTSGSLAGDAPLSFPDFSWAGGKIENTAGVVIASGGTANISGSLDKTLSDGGLLNVEGNAYVVGSGDIATTSPAASPSQITIVTGGILDFGTDADLTAANQSGRAGTLSNSGTLRKSGGTGVTEIEPSWTFINQGLVDIDTGTLYVRTAFDHSGASAIDVAADATIRFDDAVTGSNDFLGDGTIVFDKSYTPGDNSGNSTSAIEFSGNVQFGSESQLVLGLGRTIQGTEYYAVNVAGELALDGRLEVALLAPFTPSPFQSFEIISVGGSLIGTFAGLAEGSLVDNLGGTDLYITYQAGDGNDIALIASSGIAGDYNNDGTVDLADFTVWRNNLGAPAGTLPNDSAGGIVDTDQYATWKAHFGATLPPPPRGSASIPEPCTAWWLAMVGGLCQVRRLIARRDTD